MNDQPDQPDQSDQQAPAPVHPEEARSPRRSMCATVLALEAITLGLSTPVMISVSDVAPSTAVPVGVGLAVACVVVAGLLRAEWGYALGWVLQAGAVALGVLVTTMYTLGGIFAVLWASAYFLGRKIERERAAVFDAWRGNRLEP